MMMSAALTLLLSAVALAGPEWVEQGDAGATTSDAQTTVGVGPVAKISGKLEGLEGALPIAGSTDFQDVFIILVENPTIFQITAEYGQFNTEFEARIYLFTLDGEGLLGAVMDESGFVGLLNASNDGTNIVISEPGLYAVAITVAPFGPVCEEGAIFEFTFPGEISGPDGPAPDDCIFVGWEVLPVGYGACCFEDGSECLLVTEDECGILEGNYLGNGSECADCPPVGACCVGSECEITTAAGCLMMEGDYQGDGTTCDPNPCIPLGACCDYDGLCSSPVSEADCLQSGGLYAGDGTSCDTVSCVGACVLPEANTAGAGFDCFVTSQLDCQSLSGSTYLGNGSTCAGGCCFYDGTCLLADGFLDCIGMDGTFLGYNTVCGEGACLGACSTKGMGCVDGYTEAACDAESGFFFGPGTNCDDLSTQGDGSGGPTGQGGVAGIAGLPTIGVNYVINLQGTSFGTPPAGIPTLSEWALIVMGLLLLGGITVLIRRT
jgi:hypothetical protein